MKIYELKFQKQIRWVCVVALDRTWVYYDNSFMHLFSHRNTNIHTWERNLDGNTKFYWYCMYIYYTYRKSQHTNQPTKTNQFVCLYPNDQLNLCQVWREVSSWFTYVFIYLFIYLFVHLINIRYLDINCIHFLNNYSIEIV